MSGKQTSVCTYIRSNVRVFGAAKYLHTHTGICRYIHYSRYICNVCMYLSISNYIYIFFAPSDTTEQGLPKKGWLKKGLIIDLSTFGTSIPRFFLIFLIFCNPEVYIPTSDRSEMERSEPILTLLEAERRRSEKLRQPERGEAFPIAPLRSSGLWS